jgi:hypothetical protein
MPSRTWASVTTVPCTCGHLEDDAADPNSPIRYDPELNEYSIIYTGDSESYVSVLVHHCPFCGGLAPESRRGKLFCAVPDLEYERLGTLAAGVASVEDALRILGTPSSDEPVTLPQWYVPSARRDGQLSRPIRALTFRGLSDVAEVQVLVRDDKSTQVIIGAKYIGPLKRIKA